MLRDETGLVRAACWRLYNMKPSYTCTTLCEGWGSAVERWREGGDGDERKASEWLMRASPTSLLTQTMMSGARWLVTAQREDGSTT